MRLVGLVLLFLTLSVGVGSNMGSFFDPPSLIIVVGFTFGVLFMSGTSVGSMFGAVFGADLTAGERAMAARGWELARRGAVSGGFVGVIMGGIIIAKNLEDIQALGPGLAICMLTLLYGYIVGYGLCLPCQYRIENAQES